MADVLQLTCNQGHTFDPPIDGEPGAEIIIGENVQAGCPVCEALVLIPQGTYRALHGGKVRLVE